MARTASLGDIVEITSSKRIFYSEYTDRGVPFYRSKEIIEKAKGHSRTSTELFISETRFNEIKERFGVPEPGDLLLTSVGTLGIPYLVKPGDNFYFKDGNLTWFRNFKSEINNRYLIYWLTSDLGKRELENHTIGSTQKALTIQGLKKIKIFLPDIEVQEKIVAIMDGIEEKIELNRRMNETLEQIGQTIFHKYFSSNEFGAHKKLGDVLELHYGKALTAKDREVGLYPVYGSSGVVGYHNKPMIEAPGIIVGRKGNVGSVFWAEDDFYPIDTVFYVTSSLPLSLMYFYLKKAKFINSDAAVPGLNRTQVYNLDFIYPDKEMVGEVSPLLSYLLMTQRINNQTSKKLTKLRDSLLPRLISGELTV